VSEDAGTGCWDRDGVERDDALSFLAPRFEDTRDLLDLDRRHGPNLAERQRSFGYPQPRVVLRKALIASLLAAVFAAPSGGANPPVLMPGVTLENHLQFTVHGPVVFHVLTAPRPGGLWTLEPVLSNETILGTEKLSVLERQVSTAGTVGGISGDYFNSSDGHPTGILVRNGTLDRQPVPTRSSIGIDTSGALHVDRLRLIATWQGSGQRRPMQAVNDLPPTPSGVAVFTPSYGPSAPAIAGANYAVIEPFPQTLPNTPVQGPVVQVVQNGPVPIPSDGAVLVARGGSAASLAEEAPVGQTITLRLILNPTWAGVTEGLGGGPLLVRNGKPVFRANEAFTTDQLLLRQARAAIGQLADGRIVLVTVDGGQPGYSTGMTNFELAQALAGLGATTAAALGSGAQAGMAFDGNLLSRPAGAESPVSEALLVSYAGVYAPLPDAPVLSPNGDGVAEKEQLAYRVVRPSTVNANLIGPDGVARFTFSGAVQPGTYPMDWSGLKSDGTPDTEGRYRWVVSATDDLGRTSVFERRFSLNLTLGFAKSVAGTLGVPRAVPKTVATFTLTQPATVMSRIETLSGVVLKTLGRAPAPAGPLDVDWDGRTDSGAVVYSGRYVAHVSADNEFGTVDLSAQFSVRRVRS
jgi:hypothetical protein